MPVCQIGLKGDCVLEQEFEHNMHGLSLKLDDDDDDDNTLLLGKIGHLFLHLTWLLTFSRCWSTIFNIT